jgi:hypothetical protein
MTTVTRAEVTTAIRRAGRSALTPERAVEQPVVIADSVPTDTDPADALGDVVRAALRAHRARRTIGDVIA